MAVADDLKSLARARPRALTTVLSVLGYALVIGALYGSLPLFPPLADETVDLFGHVIAVINTFALASLLLGWRYIRADDVRNHRRAMLTAFSLILLFLVFYLWKTGGGYEKAIVAPDLVTIVYLIMLAIHIVLSVLAVPVVLYAVILGLTHSPAELRETAHARVGRIAVAAWSLSLFLGIVTYVMLTHLYESEPRHVATLLVLSAPAATAPGRSALTAVLPWRD